MVDQSIIQKIKAATVALGIRNYGEDNPIKIIGSGCIINSRGYYLLLPMLSRHVMLNI
jgi:hypothetical protein